MRRVLACVFFLIAPLLAQNHLQGGGPPGAATGPSFEASVGYTYLNMAMPTQRLGLNGVDANALVKFDSRWAATVDSVFASTGDVLGTGHNGNFLSFMAGPVFYPMVRRKTEIFVEGTAGVGRVNSAVPVSGTYYLGGWVTRPSYAVGGGFERSLFGPFAVRAQGGYQRTTFVDSAGATQGQNNLLVTTSIVYRFNRGGE
jgi:hypothetical protein